MPQPCDIVLRHVPFTDRSATRLRPVLVLTAATLQGDFPAAQVTSQTHHPVQVPRDDSDFELGRLPQAGIVRPDKVFTLNQSLVVRRVGRPRPSALEPIRAEMCRHFGCGE